MEESSSLQVSPLRLRKILSRLTKHVTSRRQSQDMSLILPNKDGTIYRVPFQLHLFLASKPKAMPREPFHQKGMICISGLELHASRP